jgi:hypothetical protein
MRLPAGIPKGCPGVAALACGFAREGLPAAAPDMALFLLSGY